MPPEGRELEPKHDVAGSLHYVLRCIATRPTGGARGARGAREAPRVRDRPGSQRRDWRTRRRGKR